LIPLSILFILFISLSFITVNFDNIENNVNDLSYQKPDNSGYIWARLDLTNANEINKTRFTYNDTIIVKGKVYNEWIPENKAFCNVVIVIDGEQDDRYTNVTDLQGEFQINYTIDPSLNIFTSHRIEVEVFGGPPPPPDGEVEYFHHYIIYLNTTSYFDIDPNDFNNPHLAGGYYNTPSYLNYDNTSGIPDQTINSIWKNETKDYFVPQNAPFTTNPDGSFKNIPIPDDNVSKILYLNLTYAGNSSYINGSQTLFSVNIYRNITCIWNTVGSSNAGSTIRIRGQLFARNNSNLVINFTYISLFFVNGPSIKNDTTLADGSFDIPYQIPTDFTGSYNINIEIFNFSAVKSNISHAISIAEALPIPAGSIGGGGDDGSPPFQNFFIVFIPIIIAIAAGLAIFIYFFLKKQEQESITVKLPLENRIRNLKILKDTGRIEEALSY